MISDPKQKESHLPAYMLQEDDSVPFRAVNLARQLLNLPDLRVVTSAFAIATGYDIRAARRPGQ